jgi:archaellum component FlaC
MKKAATKTTKKVTIEDLAGTIDNLAIMVAKGFDRVDERFNKVENDIVGVKKDIAEVKESLEIVEENLNTTRMDVLGIGDKFVSKHEFSQHLVRFGLLEQKVKSKK